jgi:hypothetical protein
MGERFAGNAVSMARAAAKTANASGSAVPFVQGAMLSDKRNREVVQESIAINNPNSPEALALFQQAAEIERESPEVAANFVQGKLRVANYITSRLPKPPSGAVFSPAPALDPVTERKVKRAVAAATDPVGALDRTARLQSSPEDTDAVKALYPAMWKRFQQSVLTEFKAMKTKPDMQTRLRIAYATGLNLDPTVEAGAIQDLQRVAKSTAQEEAEAKQGQQNSQDEGPVKKAAEFKGYDADNQFAGPVDARMDRR